MSAADRAALALQDVTAAGASLRLAINYAAEHPVTADVLIGDAEKELRRALRILAEQGSKA